MRLRAGSALTVLGLVVATHILSTTGAWAEDCDILSSPATCVAAAEGSVQVESADRRAAEPAVNESSPRHNRRADDLASATRAFCRDATADAVVGGGAPRAVVDICAGFAALPVAPSREEVLRAFRELPLYRGAIRTDPAAFTLVNLETYFWCGDAAGRGCDLVGEGERQVTLLGQPVRIRPRILSYGWDFGDGTGQRVTAGKAAHTYERAGAADVRLTLTWTADYAVGGGAFQPVGDTTTTTAPARSLPVHEAESVIVSGG